MADQNFKDKVVVITGGSRGIGETIACRLGVDGARVALLAKTMEPHPRLPGTLLTAAENVKKAGGEAMPIQTDLRDEAQVEAAVAQIKEKWGRIDILVNNASAIFLAGTLETPMKRFDLMNAVNVRATYLCSQKCIPLMETSDHPRILNMSPPMNLNPKWFAGHLAYTMAKYGMSMCVLGMAEEFREKGIGVNALWPKTAIATAAIGNLLGGKEALAQCRKPEIVADAAYWILSQPANFTGNFCIDEEVLKGAGETDFEKYAVTPGGSLLPDFFLG